MDAHQLLGFVSVMFADCFDDRLMFGKCDIRTTGLAAGAKAVKMQLVVDILHQQLFETLVTSVVIIFAALKVSTATEYARVI